MRSMFRFLCKTNPLRSHITTISPATFELVYLQKQGFSVKFISSISKEQSFQVSYLIDTFGFSPERAASVSKRLRFDTREKPNSVIEFFQKHGFSQSQAITIIRLNPWLLEHNPEKSFLPKVEFFKSKRVSSSDISKIIISCPNILRRSLQKQIIPSFDFFTSLFQSDSNLIRALTRYSGILINLDAVVLPNLKLLREEGVPEFHLVKMLQCQPRSLIKTHEQFKEIVEEVKEMGFNPLRFAFADAVSIITGISKSTWSRKVRLYKRWGWTDDEIIAAFRRYPHCMKYSEERVEAIMQFFVNKMGCKSSEIARRPQLLGFSLDKRIIPRASFIQVLLSKGLVKKLTLRGMFESPETVFLEKFILRHEKEAVELSKLYQALVDLAG